VTVAEPALVFGALADRTRLDILQWIGEGAAVTPTELAERLPMSRQAVSKHLDVLAEADLVVPRRVGRQVRYRVDPDGLSPAAHWLEARTRMWESSLAALADHVEEGSG
jgi:DNA-binding transcriptional ArsR family regulator